MKKLIFSIMLLFILCIPLKCKADSCSLLKSQKLDSKMASYESQCKELGMNCDDLVNRYKAAGTTCALLEEFCDKFGVEECFSDEEIKFTPISSGGVPPGIYVDKIRPGSCELENFSTYSKTLSDCEAAYKETNCHVNGYTKDYYLYPYGKYIYIKEQR